KAVHRDHFELDIEPERLLEPARQLAHRQPVTHRQRTGADEALPALAQTRALDRAPSRVRPVEHPDALSVPRGGLEHIAQRSDEGIDAAAEVLQVDQKYVEALHHRR